MKIADVQSSASWLQAWSPAEPLPLGEAENLPALIAATERSLAPCTAEGFAVAMDALFAWVERYGVIPLPADQRARNELMADIIRGYRADLGDLPDDLLNAAIRKTIKAHRFRNLPLPADICQHAEAEMSERRTLLMRLRTAELKSRQTPPAYAPPTDEERARVAEMLAKLKARPVEVQQIRAERDDLKPETIDHKAAVQRVLHEVATFRRVTKPSERRAQTDGGGDAA